ncbi:DUF1330 domain-containing protein [Stutzerimonas azotifigens]|uniref:DUF1330 domain-containing protein n=1 Tax=Stutzerimonas azotifigens TaxID=291995 RepID=A0ABR5YX03_9GAMM|nr:DUF1330 domain-containing protein [Stutzerimonas azotifigens]MBA1272468.1 DUF1330 domain-containing protein [Stutzerimonas azotifigens]
MPAYFVAIRESTQDAEELKIYSEKAAQARTDALMPLAFYGPFRMTEGEPMEGAVILQFPTFEDAEAWYDSPAYQEAVVHRFRGATYRTFIIQGVE